MTTSSADIKPIHERYAEAERYFAGNGILRQALAELAAQLNGHDINYVVIGAVALGEHGYRRFTENIDLVLTLEGLEKFNRELLGRGGWGVYGYDQLIPGSSRKLRSFPAGVDIHVMIANEYPGDGKPKPVSIPEPSKVSTEINGVNVVTFEKLIELKLASGLTAPHRLKDLADVQELIKIRGLQPEFAERLNPYVREKFVELAEAVKQSPKDED